MANDLTQERAGRRLQPQKPMIRANADNSRQEAPNRSPAVETQKGFRGSEPAPRIESPQFLLPEDKSLTAAEPA